MGKYRIYIDETGGFSYTDKQKNCFVGGWVCDQSPKLDEYLLNFFKENVAAYNKTPEVTELIYPDHMHFFPMHLETHRQDASIFFERVFAKIRKRLRFVFRSQGAPVIIPHEQAGYMEILRNTLVQLVRDLCRTGKQNNLHIVIATRRQEILYGFSGFGDPKGYERNLSEKLASEMKKSLPGDLSCKIKIEFGSAFRDPGLILADFFCGAMKYGKANYLDEYDDIRKYQFSAGFGLVGATLIEQMKYVALQDPVGALLLGVQAYTWANGERYSFLEDCYQGLDRQQKGVFSGSVLQILDDLLIKRADRYDFLGEAGAMITLVRRLLPVDSSDMDGDELQLKAGLDLHEIRIVSHQGKTHADMVTAYLAFLQRYRNELFSNQMAFLQQLVDATLIGIQVLAFNNLQFIAVEQALKPVRDLYEKVFGAIAGEDSMPDENRAKLEGTYGQMCGFLYNITGEEDYFLKAEQSLQNDVAACHHGTHTWEQGMGFLSALYWRNGKLEQAREQFFLETQTSSEDFKTNLYDLNRYNLFGGMEKPFFVLQRCRICALAAKNGEQITGLDSYRDKLNSMQGLTRYPRFVAAKWLAVVYLLKGQAKDALKLLEAALGTKDSGDFAIDFIRLPMKLLVNHCLEKEGKTAAFSLNEELQHLEDLQQGTREILKQLRVDRFSGNAAGWDPYEVVLLPPFYYA